MLEVEIKLYRIFQGLMGNDRVLWFKSHGVAENKGLTLWDCKPDMINKEKHNQKLRPYATVSSDVRDYGSEPFFIKKADDSKKFLEKHGFPKAFLKRSGKS